MNFLILPGMDGHADLHDEFHRCLGGPATTVAYDSQQALGYDDLEVLVRARIDAIDGPLVLIAESFSGPIAFRLGAHPAPNVVAVVFAATFVRSPVPTWLNRFVTSFVFRAPPPKAVLGRLLTGFDGQLTDEISAAIKRVRPEVLATRVRHIINTDSTQLAEALKIPALSIRAQHDRMVPSSVSPASVGLAEQVIDGPHLILRSRPEACARVVNDFVKDSVGHSL